MGLRKCPKCELNYIREDQQLCDVCSRKRKIQSDDNEEILCVECGEHPAMRGKDVCAYCFKEALRQEQASSQRVNSPDIAYGELEIDDVEAPLADEEIPESDEMDEIAEEFGDDNIEPDDMKDGSLIDSTEISNELDEKAMEN